MRHWITPHRAKRLLASRNGEGIRIAVIDSGVEISHPAFRGMKLADDLAFTPDGSRVRVVPGNGRDVFGHGTAVASVIHQLAPKAKVGSFRVLGGDNSSKTAIILRAAHEAMDRGYQILNCSFGCRLPREVMFYKQWVDEAYRRGIHIVAACNNSDFETPEWPGHFPSVISVNMAATRSQTLFFYYKGSLIEFAARGVDDRLPWIGGITRVVTGSSFAAPRVAAMLARLLSGMPDIPPLLAKAVLRQVAAPWKPKVAGPNVLN